MEDNVEKVNGIYQPQINDELRLAIEKIIQEYETTYNINVFFASDTGSRSLGVAVESSDFDLNGFYVADYMEYIKLIRKSPVIISRQGIKFEVSGKEYDIDIQLWDIKDWLREKVENNNLGCDFLFESLINYRNSQPEILSLIRQKIESPFYYFWGKFKNNYNLCLKDIQKEGTQNKKIMNTLIYCTQYLHSRIFNNFPDYNIFKEIDFMIDNKDVIAAKIGEDEYNTLLQCFEFIKVCYEEKKKGRKSLTKDLPDFVNKFADMLNSKLNARSVKLDIENPWNVDIAQSIFDQLIAAYKGKKV